MNFFPSTKDSSLEASHPNPGIAAIFPGQGSQYPGMGHWLPWMRSLSFKDGKSYSLLPDFPPSWPLMLQEAEEVFQQRLENLLGQGDATLLKASAQILMFLTSMAFWGALIAYDVDVKKFSFAAGHSLGEYSALCASGALPFSLALKWIHQRQNFMTSLCPKGSMVAVLNLSFDQLESWLSSLDNVECVISNHNSPTQIVLSGTHEGLERVKKIFDQESRAKARWIPLSVEGPFHSPWMQAAQEAFNESIQKEALRTPFLPIVSNVTGNASQDPTLLKKQLEHHMVSPVQWEKTLQYLFRQGVESFLEVGSGKVLCGLVAKTLKSTSCWSVDTCQNAQELSHHLKQYGLI